MEDLTEKFDPRTDYAISSINNLKTSIAFIKSCFKHLPYQKTALARFTMTYHGNDEEYATGVENILFDLIRCVQFQIESKMEIDIAAHLNISQNILLDSREIELHYYGQLRIFESGGWIMFCDYFPNNYIRVELHKETSGETLLELFERFQEAIMSQIVQNRDINDDTQGIGNENIG